jgi:hypothetical protein
MDSDDFFDGRDVYASSDSLSDDDGVDAFHSVTVAEEIGERILRAIDHHSPSPTNEENVHISSVDSPPVPLIQGPYNASSFRDIPPAWMNLSDTDSAPSDDDESI